MILLLNNLAWNNWKRIGVASLISSLLSN